MPEPITPDQLNAIPLEHRRTIALWLYQRGDQYAPSLVLTAGMSMVLRDAFAGAAVDLADPLSDDSTIGHGAHVLGSIGAFDR